ncbi:arginine deiminase-related protein [Apibacter raozihei]|uniref:dimethylarginine dimethylaminohydrolase family protein n=1 Tax=Apibacter TaxID=1778601 RepID=UPI000FE313A6|nr:MULTISPECIES: arginine deiminase-related protein [Apibacter]
MQLNIKNETSQLKTVVLGQPVSVGKTPQIKDTYDAKSYESVSQGTYPQELDIINEMTCFENILSKHGVEVLRPRILENCNQVFARDVAFVIDDKIIISNIIPDRSDEQEAYKEIFDTIYYQKIYNLPEKAHVEGGDIIVFDDIVFCGVYKGNDYSNLKTARTNIYAIEFLNELYPDKTFVDIELKKDDKDPYKGILHLDCTFMPVGDKKAIVYKDGFKNEKDFHFLVDFFGKSNIFEITPEEMYYMNTNIFSISPQLVVSEERFTRLNHFLETNWGIQVEKIPYYEISKMGGLLRCSTLPLIRQDEK